MAAEATTGESKLHNGKTTTDCEHDLRQLKQAAGDRRFDGSIDRLALERAVASLPAGYRLIFILHDIEGFEHNEIASMLDCSIGNSKSQLHKARLKLRDVLRALPGQEERG